MILSRKDELMESDFAMSFAYLLNFKEPEDVSVLFKEAIRIKQAVFKKLKAQRKL